MTAMFDGYGNRIPIRKSRAPQPDLALVADMLREPERFTEGAREEQALLCEQADNAEAARIGTVKRSAASEDGLPELPTPTGPWHATSDDTGYYTYTTEQMRAYGEQCRRLAASGQGVEWQPIESAPKDGTGVLGFISPTWIEGIFWNGEDWSYLSDGDITPSGRNVPTHWMPLPAAPAQEGK